MFTVQAPNADVTKEEEQSKDKKPLLTKSAVLRLLAELSRSYAGCAVLICQHVYHAGQSELITEVCVVFPSLLLFCNHKVVSFSALTLGDRQGILH